MSGWGISENASEKEKIKAEYADYLHGLNSCGEISYRYYSEMFDIGMRLLDEMYEIGRKEQIPAKPYKARSEYYCPGCYGSIKTCVGKNHRDGHKTRHAYCFNCGQRIDWSDE